jgi:hypothetical protein
MNDDDDDDYNNNNNNSNHKDYRLSYFEVEDVVDCRP